MPAHAEPTAKRIALLIANGNYPDAATVSATPRKDATALAEELKRHAFEVTVKTDLAKQDMDAAVRAFMAAITPGTTALFYYNGFGIQAERQTFLLPVNAQIWSESEVKRDGLNLDSLLAEMNRRGARVKIAIIDAARRNPFERHFRAYSAGLAAIDPPEGTLALYAVSPNKLAKDATGDASLFMSELVKEIRAPDLSADEVFARTRLGVSQASNKEEVPWVSSSLTDPFSFGTAGPARFEDPAPKDLTPKDLTPKDLTPKDVAPKDVAPEKTATDAPVPKPDDKATPTQPAPADFKTSELVDEKKSKRPDLSKAPDPSKILDAAKTPDPVKTPETSPPEAQKAVDVSKKIETLDEAKTTEPPKTTEIAPPKQSEAAKPDDAKPLAGPPKPGDTFTDCATCPEMIVIPAGSFDMGSGSTPYDKPVHRVTIAEPFAMSKTPITFELWDLCVAARGCKVRPDDQGWGGGDQPVINISWFDARDYTIWLSKATGHAYRLPSEAEWEYAAHGGTKTAFFWGSTLGTNHANCQDCGAGAGDKTMPVRSFAANPYGLYDMAGNAAEWVEDCWNETYRNAPRDGSAWKTGTCAQHVLRGGAFNNTSAYIKPTARYRYDADVRYYSNGFRVLRSLK